MSKKLLVISLLMLLSGCAKQVPEVVKPDLKLEPQVTLEAEKAGLLDGQWFLTKGDNRIELQINSQGKQVVIKEELRDVFTGVQGEVILLKELREIENNPGDVLKKASVSSEVQGVYVSLTASHEEKEGQLKELLTQLINQQTNQALKKSELSSKIVSNGQQVVCYIDEPQLLEKINQELAKNQQLTESFVIYPEAPNQLTETWATDNQIQRFYTYERENKTK